VKRRKPRKNYSKEMSEEDKEQERKRRNKVAAQEKRDRDAKRLTDMEQRYKELLEQNRILKDQWENACQVRRSLSIAVDCCLSLRSLFQLTLLFRVLFSSFPSGVSKSGCRGARPVCQRQEHTGALGSAGVAG
jgi:hypothetical protein